ncbi:DNA polymerase alpha/epsilon subunit B-domain-containing protein [Dunaliella salina]|uniref:DNA polymerase II subunit 2 n=1 Tax=Dunaliella salina TaxID=3046 RepID=A0ABQ7GCT9_DUNSA|nr:DNA polymerase alpha/epsilon subunit B-domain-containing protein [Dunaliella salina]|eukprot:KAF5832409.1 DNA polymerase alpha/epsilon subunit B-domain-containing protein [Dunaliella salina]
MPNLAAGSNNSAGVSAGGAQAGAASVSYSAIKAGFDKLAALLQQFPRIQNNSHFVFVPGPGDPCPGDVLPQPPLPSYFTEQLRATLPKVSFTSNPCRLRFYSQQLVFFRYDILKRMRRRCIIPPIGGESADADAMWGHLTLTLLQQSHLCPLPLLQQPIYWQYDHAMHIYPLPHAVVVADTSPQAQHNHQGCSTFNPGSFADGFFAAYVPFKQGMETEGEGEVKAVEMCEMPRDGQLEPYEEDEDGEEGGVGNGLQGEASPRGLHHAQQLAAEGVAMDIQGNGNGLAFSRAGNGGDDDGDGGTDGGEGQGSGADAGERDEGYYSTLTHGLGVGGSVSAMAQAGAPEAAGRQHRRQEPQQPLLAQQARGREEGVVAGEKEEEVGTAGQQGLVGMEEHGEGVLDQNGDVEMGDAYGGEDMGQGGPDHQEEGMESGEEDEGEDFPEIMD